MLELGAAAGSGCFAVTGVGSVHSVIALTLVRDHLDHCLSDAVGTLDGPDRARIDEFRHIAKYL
ncbi:hypothetical protein [Devosia psychrophila]|uniref:hypothetical protein n=1 Tax=Devosia psychrophila TaxID=728005 RepID=UPI0011608E03